MLNESSDQKKSMAFANYVYEHFPNFNGLDAEPWFKLWNSAKFKNNLPVSVTLKRVEPLAFRNIHFILKLLGTLSITT